MMSNLSSLCTYAKGKVSVDTLSKQNYVSTENMLPNKEGIVDAGGLPSVQYVQQYIKGDILVSNIRPYFKKIWMANEDGGCSNDVLVFRAAHGCDSTFLYYVLSNDAFFNYASATSKGTKMPRGDKIAIMQYEVPCFDHETQLRIGKLLRSIDARITVNKKINDNLQQQVSALFDNWFVDFGRFDGNMPIDWHSGKLADIANVTSGKRPPLKSSEKTASATIPLVGAASVMGYTSDTLYDSPILVTGRVGTHGVVQRFYSSCWPSDNTLVITSPFYEFTDQVLRRVDYVNMNRGSTQPLITQTDLKNIEIVIPSDSVLKEFESLASTLMQKHAENCQENQRLYELRDALLPRLISGEIIVSDVQV